jgi:3',5'-nucleoside bisphosphate phosphatase
MMFRADLHCHSLFSDGTLTPQELIMLAKQVGLSGLSITDHDSVEAYETAKKIAKEEQILLGTGAEFSCVFKERNVHVLAYDIDIKEPELIAFCQRHLERRTERNRVILEKLKKMNILLEEQELLNMGRMIGRPHIALLLKRKGYVSSMKEAFNLYIGDDKPCYYRGTSFSIEETLTLIHKAGGKAFIAHPHLLQGFNALKELLNFPFDGIECHYARLPADQERRYIKLAKERNLLISGGSDFHGESSEHTPLGSSWVDEETFCKIFIKTI